MPILLTLFCTILSDMRAALGTFMSKPDHGTAVVWLGTRAYSPVQPLPTRRPISTEILTLAWHRINRAAQRFQRLYRRWLSCTLPQPRPSRAGQTRRERPKTPYFPRRHAWLAASTDHHVRGHASQLSHLLARPDAEEFLKSVPQAGRIVRPLCHMLGIPLPTALILPTKPGAARPRPESPRPENLPFENPPPAPIHHGKYTPAQIRRYSPGRIPKPIPQRP